MKSVGIVSGLLFLGLVLGIGSSAVFPTLRARAGIVQRSAAVSVSAFPSESRFSAMVPPSQIGEHVSVGTRAIATSCWLPANTPPPDSCLGVRFRRYSLDHNQLLPTEDKGVELGASILQTVLETARAQDAAELMSRFVEKQEEYRTSTNLLGAKSSQREKTIGNQQLRTGETLVSAGPLLVYVSINNFDCRGAGPCPVLTTESIYQRLHGDVSESDRIAGLLHERVVYAWPAYRTLLDVVRQSYYR